MKINIANAIAIDSNGVGKRCTSEHVIWPIVCNTFISKLFTVITYFIDQKRNKYVGVEVYVNDLSFQATDMFVTFGKFSKMQ